MYSICMCSFVYIYKICIYLYIAKSTVSRPTSKVNTSFLRFSHDSLFPRVRSASRVPLLATVSCVALLCTEDVSFGLTTLSVLGQLPCWTLVFKLNRERWEPCISLAGEVQGVTGTALQGLCSSFYHMYCTSLLSFGSLSRATFNFKWYVIKVTSI